MLLVGTPRGVQHGPTQPQLDSPLVDFYLVNFFVPCAWLMLHEDHSKTFHSRVLSGVDRAPPLSVLRKRMLPEYGKWLTSLLTAKPDLKVGLSQEVDLGT